MALPKYLEGNTNYLGIINHSTQLLEIGRWYYFNAYLIVNEAGMGQICWSVWYSGDGAHTALNGRTKPLPAFKAVKAADKFQKWLNKQYVDCFYTKKLALVQNHMAELAAKEAAA